MHFAADHTRRHFEDHRRFFCVQFDDVAQHERRSNAVLHRFECLLQRRGDVATFQRSPVELRPMCIAPDERARRVECGRGRLESR